MSSSNFLLVPFRVNSYSQLLVDTSIPKIYTNSVPSYMTGLFKEKIFCKQIKS